MGLCGGMKCEGKPYAAHKHPVWLICTIISPLQARIAVFSCFERKPNHLDRLSNDCRVSSHYSVAKLWTNDTPHLGCSQRILLVVWTLLLLLLEDPYLLPIMPTFNCIHTLSYLTTLPPYTGLGLS